MRLVLTLAAEDQPPPGKTETRVFDGRGVTIGRGADNDWVLPDPERHLSKRHCVIAFADDRYTITDTSTNGVFLNHSTTALGRGNSAPLRHGDRIEFGDYALQVALTTAEPAPPPAARPDPVLTTMVPGPPAELADDPDPFGIDKPRRPDRVPDGASFGAPSRRLDDPFDENPSHLPAGAAGTTAEERASNAKLPSIPSDSMGSFERIPRDADIFGPGAAPEEDWSGPSQGWQVAADSDHVPADQGFFRPPEVARQQIPEDWDADWDSPATPPSRPSVAPPAEPPLAPPPIAPPPRDDADAAGGPPPLPPAERTPAPPRLAPLGGPADQADRAVLQAFLQGAGLDRLDIPDGEAAEIMYTVGQAFREMVSGLRDILTARATMKSEFRLQKTMIGAINNNPLKFSADVDESLTLLIRPPARGFQPAVQAVREGVQDLKAHQMATLAGMQVALAALLRQFDPAALKQQLEKSSLLDSILPGSRKAKYWEIYEQMYKQIAGEAEENFHGLYGSAFARAYEEQVRKL